MNLLSRFRRHHLTPAERASRLCDIADLAEVEQQAWKRVREDFTGEDQAELDRIHAAVQAVIAETADQIRRTL